MNGLTRDGTAEPVSRDQILRHARGQGNVHFPCSADHEQEWQPYPVDPYSAIICDDHTYINTYIHTYIHLVLCFSQDYINYSKSAPILCKIYQRPIFPTSLSKYSTKGFELGHVGKGSRS